MGAHVQPGQPHQGHGGQGESAACRAEPGQGGGTEGDGNGRVPGQVPEPGGVAAAAVDPGQQRPRPGPAHHLLDQLRQRPGAGAAKEEPGGQFAVSGPPGGERGRGYGAESPQLHDDPDGRVQPIRQAVDGPEGYDLAGAHAVAVHGADRTQQRGETHAEPGPRIGQRFTKLHRLTITAAIGRAGRQRREAAENPYRYRGFPGCPRGRGAPLSENTPTVAEETRG